MNMIETKDLTKTYGDFTAVSHLSLHIPKGAVYGFLGPNGAGKSTTMKMFLGLTKPDSGSFTIDGRQYPKDRIEILKEIGSFLEAPSFYGNLTGEENLDIIRKILGLPKAAVTDALELVGLTPFKNRLARKYSLGMRQRLGLAGALISKPPILILDEPTNGLDPIGIHEIRSLIRSLPKQFDCTVLVSSHLLSEIELMADNIGILNRGKLIFEGTMPHLKEQALQKGYPTDNLEDTFLAFIHGDNGKEMHGYEPGIGI
ncbi:MAG: ABC transporter ATP-binding protein [Bacteroides sp.]|nr:ABC transporter ATP-binding protein [Bacteroides sp.]